MSLGLRCPACRNRMSVPEYVMGRRVQCPSCEHVFRYTGQRELTLGRVRSHVFTGALASALRAEVADPPMAVTDPDMNLAFPPELGDDIKTMPFIDLPPLPSIPEGALDQLTTPVEEPDVVSLESDHDLESRHGEPSRAEGVADVSEAEIEALFQEEEPVAQLVAESAAWPQTRLPGVDPGDLDADVAIAEVVEPAIELRDAEAIEPVELTEAVEDAALAELAVVDEIVDVDFSAEPAELLEEASPVEEVAVAEEVAPAALAFVSPPAAAPIMAVPVAAVPSTSTAAPMAFAAPIAAAVPVAGRPAAAMPVATAMPIAATPVAAMPVAAAPVAAIPLASDSSVRAAPVAIPPALPLSTSTAEALIPPPTPPVSIKPFDASEDPDLAALFQDSPEIAATDVPVAEAAAIEEVEPIEVVDAAEMEIVHEGPVVHEPAAFIDEEPPVEQTRPMRKRSVGVADTHIADEIDLNALFQDDDAGAVAADDVPVVEDAFLFEDDPPSAK